VDIRDSVESLFEAIRAKLGGYLRQYGRRFDHTVQEGPLYNQAIEWLGVAGAIKRLFDFDKGPLADLISNADDWQIDMEAMVARIGARLVVEVSGDVPAFDASRCSKN